MQSPDAFRPCAMRKLRIYLDYGRINRPQSPVYNPWESLLPILAPMLVGIALMWWTGVIFGLLFIIGMILIYSNVVKRKLNALLIQRTKDFITSGYDNCCTLWEFGGLVLVNAENKKITEPGEFRLWISPDSQAGEAVSFTVK